MDKRKVSGGGVPGEDLDERAAKRRKPLADTNDLLTGETAESTTKSGLALLETVRKTVDKSGRLISTSFLTLPNKRLLPDYYKVTKMPIALDTIEAKLKQHEFPNLAVLESYFKRMILNAKEYNQKGSEIYEDAERLRKALSNFMTKHNPAYKTIPGYSSVPTPLPGQADGAANDKDANDEPDEDVADQVATKKKPTRHTKSTDISTPRSSATPALSDAQYASVDFAGLTFQQAQEKIVEDMIREKELPEDEFSAFEPFIALPSKRDYRDYYNVIKQPVSLKTLQKSVRGVQGKAAATGISNFKSWAAFAEEASLIWKNAYFYNEDGSDIFVLAKDLEKFFTRILQEAKAVVPEPAGTKIKLRMSEPAPKILLKLGGGNKASPAPQESTTPRPPSQPNGTNGASSLVNGSGRRNPFGGSHSSVTPVPNLEQLERARSVSGSVASPSPSTSAPVKNEDVRNSPAVATPFNGYRGGSQSATTPGPSNPSMQPPSTPALPNLYSQGGYAQSFNHTQYHAPNSNPSFDSKWRQPGKNASDAMIVNLSLATHPQLNISRHFRMEIPPSPTMAQHSVTINLPSSHFYLQIKPELASSVLQRHHKLFVTKGNDRLHAMPTIPSHPVDQRRPLFETRLTPGVNRIDIELIAALPKGVKSANGQDVELETITIFANLMR